MFKGHENSIMHYGSFHVPVGETMLSGSNVTLRIDHVGDVEYYDPFSLRTSTTQVTIKSPGLYVIVVSGMYAGHTASGATLGTWRSVSLYKNAAQAHLSRWRPNGDGDFPSSLSPTYTVDLVAGDVLTMVGRYQGSGTLDVGQRSYLAIQQVTKGLT